MYSFNILRTPIGHGMMSLSASHGCPLPVSMANHACDMFHHWGVLMATTQMIHCLNVYPSMVCYHGYIHNGQWRDVDNNEVPCPIYFNNKGENV